MSKGKASNMIENQSRNIVLMWAALTSGWLRECKKVEKYNENKKWWQPEKMLPSIAFLPEQPPAEMIDKYIDEIPIKDQKLLGLLK